MSENRLGRAAAFLGRLLRRTGRGPLRPLWAGAHVLGIRTLAWYLRRGLGATVYLKGGFGFGEPVYGLSDVDMFVVTADAEQREALRRRFERLQRAVPPLAQVVQLWVYDREGLARVSSRSFLRQGVGRPLTPDELAVAEHPGLYGPTRDWRRLGAPADEWPDALTDPDERRLSAWLELQFWWAYAFEAAVVPDATWSPYLCVKLVAEPARAWLWLEHGEQMFGRREALERTRERLPEEAEALERALALLRRVPTTREAPVAHVLPALVRFSQRIARRLAEEAAAAGTTEVRLVWGGEDELVLSRQGREALAPWPGVPVFPLVDWWARARSEPNDEAFALVPGNAADPGRLRQAALAGRAETYAVLRADDLLVFPTTEIWERGRFRAVQSAVTDPVSFALASGERRARFPRVPGFSAEDSARRAVEEHRIQLSVQTTPGADLGALFGAARAALFRDSLERREPELLLTAAAIARALGAEEAFEHFRAWRVDGVGVDEAAVAAFRRRVQALSAYA